MKLKLIVVYLNIFLLLNTIYVEAMPANGKKISKSNESISILIDINEENLYVIDTNKNKILKIYNVAVGKNATPSPTGTWKVIDKAMWSGGFGTRWIGLNVPWGMYGIHGTNNPDSIGKPVSHGCIRMHNRDVEELYKSIKINTTVIIYSGPCGPFQENSRELVPGDRGADVYMVQKILKDRNVYDGFVDGIYSEKMKSCVVKVKQENGLGNDYVINRDFYNVIGIKNFE